MRRNPKGVYCNRKRLADGSLAIYYTLRHHGTLKPLPGDESELFRPWSPTFMRAYYAALSGPAQARTAGTLQALINGYTKSADFARLAPRTKSDYLAHIAKIETAQLVESGPAFATYPLDVVEDPKIRRRLLEGLDDIGVTLKQSDAIDRYEAGRERRGPVTTALA